MNYIWFLFQVRLLSATLLPPDQGLDGLRPPDVGVGVLVHVSILVVSHTMR